MYIRSFVACLALSLLGVGSLFADDEQLQVTGIVTFLPFDQLRRLGSRHSQYWSRH